MRARIANEANFFRPFRQSWMKQSYMLDKEGDVGEPIGAVERAASYAEGVLKTEWETVKFGERAYRDSVRATKHTLIGSFAVLAVLVVGIPVYVYSSDGGQGNKPTNQTKAVQPKAAPMAAPPAAHVLTATAK